MFTLFVDLMLDVVGEWTDIAMVAIKILAGEDNYIYVLTDDFYLKHPKSNFRRQVLDSSGCPYRMLGKVC